MFWIRVWFRWLQFCGVCLLSFLTLVIQTRCRRAFPTKPYTHDYLAALIQLVLRVSRRISIRCLHLFCQVRDGHWGTSGRNNSGVALRAWPVQAGSSPRPWAPWLVVGPALPIATMLNLHPRLCHQCHLATSAGGDWLATNLTVSSFSRPIKRRVTLADSAFRNHAMPHKRWRTQMARGSSRQASHPR